jgi:hypothetical protein
LFSAPVPTAWQAGQAFVEGALAFLDVLRCGFLQQRRTGGSGDKGRTRKKRSFHPMCLVC